MTVYLEAPLTDAPLRGGLLSVAQVADFTSPHEGAGVDWAPSPCGPAALAPGVCDSAIDVPDEPKEFDGVPFVSSPPFGVYKGIKCDLTSDWADRARIALELGEAIPVERAFHQIVLNGSETVYDSGAPARGVVAALGALETYARANYGKQAVIHLTAGLATAMIAEGLLTPDLNFNLTTKMGTAVAVLTYDDSEGPADTTAPSGAGFAYVTGQVFLRRGEVISTHAPDVRANEGVALAERLWVAAAECFVYAVLVDYDAPEGS